MASPYPPASSLPGGGRPQQQQQYGQQQQQSGNFGQGGQGPQGGYGGHPPPQQYGAGGGGYQQGGYQQQHQQQGHYPPPAGGPPPQGGGGGYPQNQGGDPQLRQWFQSVDVDNSGYISVIELTQALMNGDWSPFSAETITMLMNMFDADRSGSIGFNEFAGLWQYIKDWQGVFRNFDTDRSGTIESRELSAALAQFGFNLPPQVINSLEKKFHPPPVVKPGQQNRPMPPGIPFDAFVRCCVTVRHLSQAFRNVDQDQDGWVNMSYGQFLEIVLGAP